MPDAPIIQMSQVNKSFDGKKALDGLTFTVNTGEIFGFLGPSGAGKTTTIKLLTRQLRADGGDIRLFGQEISKLSADAFDRIGVLSDTSGLYERLSVYENLAVFAEIMRVPKPRIQTVLDETGLAPDAKKPAKKLSRGMKQRLMLGRALLHQPALLFLDEPTSSLDPSTTRQIHEALLALHKNGTTIFLTTHNMEEADRLCQRVAFLSSGSIVAMDSPERLKLANAKDDVEIRTTTDRRIHCANNAASIRAALDGLNGEGLVTIKTDEPTLEDVFIQLTGRELHE
ncbi:bacitracin ABC transporter ATP-binding protein [Clostridia bacterium]|nr:bacitracin ABC transporter ATP-binding protein [Clostridia bacterium]